MKIRSVSLVTAIFSFALVGCANQTDPEAPTVESLAQQVEDLSYQVSVLQTNAVDTQLLADQNLLILDELNQIQQDMAVVYSSTSMAYDEAVRANNRIDNMAKPRQSK